MNILREISLVPKGLRYKLMIAFCLMSVIPLLLAAYLISDYIFTPTGDIIVISWALFFCLIITILGLILVKKMVEPVIEMAIEARLIAEGDLDRRISVVTEDEIGDLARSINQLTLRIKENMAELTSYGERTKLINIEIHKSVLALSSLLQIGEHISAFAPMKDTMSLIIDKVSQIIDTGYAMLFLPKSSDPETLEPYLANNTMNDKLRQLEIIIGKGILGMSLARGSIVYADSKTKFSKDIEEFREKYGVKNFVAFPILSHNKPIGTLLLGNEVEDFKFKDGELELIKIFTKQAAIAYESDLLARKTKELAIKDDLTDLYNEKYITTRLDEEIKRAVLYQRPCSYIVFNVDNFNRFREENGELATEKALRKIASVLQEYVTQIGRAARLSGDEFALLLPEKNKKEAYIIAEEIRKRVENLDLGLEKKTRLTISGGVSENPLDGSTAEGLIEKATKLVSMAKAQGKNRIG
jgi:diguanylate cyclase (GGDEF)-like protein